MKKEKELQDRETKIYEELKSLDPDTDESVNLQGELDEIQGKLDALDTQ